LRCPVILQRLRKEGRNPWLSTARMRLRARCIKRLQVWRACLRPSQSRTFYGWNVPSATTIIRVRQSFSAWDQDVALQTFEENIRARCLVLHLQIVLRGSHVEYFMMHEKLEILHGGGFACRRSVFSSLVTKTRIPRPDGIRQ